MCHPAKQKSNNLGVRGVCKVKAFASILVFTSFPSFDMQHDHIQTFVLPLNPIRRLRVCVKGQNMCLYVALSSIPFKLICDMAVFRKKK